MEHKYLPWKTIEENLHSMKDFAFHLLILWRLQYKLQSFPQLLRSYETLWSSIDVLYFEICNISNIITIFAALDEVDRVKGQGNVSMKIPNDESRKCMMCYTYQDR
jgi:hypothetical protein